MATVTEHCHKHHHYLSHITWTAIILGTLVAIGIGFLFSLFNIGIGLYSFTLDPQIMGNIAIVGYIWLIICGIITLFIAGWVAGRIAAFSHLRRRFGVLVGFATWTLALIVTLAMTSHINTLLPTNVHVIASPAATNEMIQTVTSPGDNKVTVNAEKVTNAIGKVTLATFILFLLSAIASCVGGYVGMKLRPEDNHFIHNEPLLHEPIQRPVPPPSDRPLPRDIP